MNLMKKQKKESFLVKLVGWWILYTGTKENKKIYKILQIYNSKLLQKANEYADKIKC